MQPLWERYAPRQFLAGLDRLALDSRRIPRLAEVNRSLEPLTGFQARAVSGYVPAYLFFDSLRGREFPTTVTIRPGNKLDYLPEPDIFHDIAGHVPMHTDSAFAQALVRFGDCARSAAERAAETRGAEERVRRLSNNVRALARVFWFTVEFGLMRTQRGKLCACGSGLLSSFGELKYAIESPLVHREPFQLEWAIHQGFEINRYQPLLFVLDSFDQLHEIVDTLETWIRSGRLDAVAPGEPAINDGDLKSFLDAGKRRSAAAA
jgi:phenylalanine-4-hydroxylase